MSTENQITRGYLANSLQTDAVCKADYLKAQAEHFHTAAESPLSDSEIFRAGYAAGMVRQERYCLQAAPGAISITAVAVTKKNDDGDLYLDWLLEGGICELEHSGVVLLATDGTSLTGDDGHGEVYTLPQPAPGWVQDSWRPMESAPKDGTLLRLLVEFDDCAIDDGEGPFATVGQNFLDTTGEDAWQFVGWDWEQDVFVDGIGRPVGWMPMLAAPSQPAAQGEYGDAYQGAREDLAIWKRRALEAEEKLRSYDNRIVGLGVLAMETATRPEQAEAASCLWKREMDSGIYETGCGQTWAFTDGTTPDENSACFCHHCGGVLQVQQLTAYQVGDNDIVAAYDPEGAIEVLSTYCGYAKDEFTTDDVVLVNDETLDATEAFDQDEGKTIPLDKTLRQELAELTEPAYLHGWE